MSMNFPKISTLAFCGLVSGTLWAQSVNLAPIPLTVDNGASVPVTAVFSPPMRSGERAVFSVNGVEVLQAVPRQGEVAELGLRLVLPRTQNEVQVSRYAGGVNPSEEHVRRVEAVLPGTLGTASALSVADARTRFSPEGGGYFSHLVDGRERLCGCAVCE